MNRSPSSRSARAVWVFAALIVVGAGVWAYLRFWRVPAGPAPVASVAPAPVDGLVDPLAPERVARRDLSRPAASNDWVTARPAFQYSRSPKERGGVEPCNLPPADVSALEDWHRLPQGRFVAPRDGALDANGGFDLVLNFHGDDLARRELAHSGQKLVLYSLTLDPGKSYAPLFAGTQLFPRLIRQIEELVGNKAGRAAHARHVGLSAWSAGYVAVLSILAQPEHDRVDSIVLIDGLHGARGALERSLAPLADFARRAASGERFFLVTHSSIDPPGFASTTEAAHYLVSALNAKPEPVRRDDGAGLELIEFFTRGSFHVRGYAGNDKADHCAQVMLLRQAYSAIAKRWSGAKPR